MTPIRTAADLVASFGAIPLSRVVVDPPPGEATVEDVTRLHETGLVLEYVDGLLLRKPESDRALRLVARLREALIPVLADRETGLLVGTNALFRLATNRLRIANLAVIDVPVPPEHRPGERLVSEYPPLLAVEVLGPEHTGEEMESKLHDWFTAGARLVWYVYPALGEVHVYPSIETVEMLRSEDTLTGRDVLPGFQLLLGELFDQTG